MQFIAKQLLSLQLYFVEQIDRKTRNTQRVLRDSVLRGEVYVCRGIKRANIFGNGTTLFNGYYWTCKEIISKVKLTDIKVTTSFSLYKLFIMLI